MKIRALSVAVLAASMFVVVGCANSKTETKSAASMGMVNSHCPMTHEDLSATSPTTMYKGQKVGFCCPGCEKKFEALSDEQKAAKLAGAK